MAKTKPLKFIMALLSILFLSCAAFAQSNALQEDRIKKLEETLAAAQSAGDNAWMLIACALGLLMTCPGLALFYGGIVRRENVLATNMQRFIVNALVSA